MAHVSTEEAFDAVFLGRPVVGAGGAAAAGGRDDSATVTLRFFGFSVANRILTRLMYTRNMITFGGPDVEVVEESLVQSTTVTHRLTAQSGERLLLRTPRLHWTAASTESKTPRLMLSRIRNPK